MLCRVLEVSSSGYYDWQQRQPSQRRLANEALSNQIQEVFRQGRGVYGYPRVTAALHQQGVPCGRHRVARLMRQAGLIVLPQKHSTRTTDSQHSHPIAPNLLQRNFAATAPNQKWVGDITGVWTQAGWLYVAALVDIYSRMVVGWAMSAHRDEQLVEDALQMALSRRHPNAGLLHHTDRGSQYTSGPYRAVLQARGITMSMSKKGDCYDNALMESFWGTMKTECVDRHTLI